MIRQLDRMDFVNTDSCCWTGNRKTHKAPAFVAHLCSTRRWNSKTWSRPRFSTWATTATWTQCWWREKTPLTRRPAPISSRAKRTNTTKTRISSKWWVGLIAQNDCKKTTTTKRWLYIIFVECVWICVCVKCCLAHVPCRSVRFRACRTVSTTMAPSFKCSALHLPTRRPFFMVTKQKQKSCFRWLLLF